MTKFDDEAFETMPPRFSNALKKLPGLAAVCLLAACTASFTYNHLDWLIPWMVDDYVDLSRDQRKALQARLTPALQWHREEELARYVAILDQMERDMAGPLVAEQVRNWFGQIIEAAERTEKSMLLVFLDFGHDLSDDQLNEFFGNVWQRQREYEEEFLERSDEEYVEDNSKYLVELMEDFLGRLQPAQKQRLQEAAASLQRFDSAWLEERELWLTGIEPLLQREAGWQKAVQNRYSTRIIDRTPRYHDILDKNLGVISKAAADVLNQRSSKQSEHADREIDKLRGKLQKLQASQQQLTRAGVFQSRQG
jgi:hypothetical protein